MAAPKKKPKIQASDVEVGKRTLESVLIDLAEQVKANDARCAERSARVEERCARAEERSARAEEQATIALQTIAAVTQDLRALAQEIRAVTQEFRAFAGRTDRRLNAIEEAASA
jgi:ABC-type transporter Mla subunit MlaD